MDRAEALFMPNGSCQLKSSRCPHSYATDSRPWFNVVTFLWAVFLGACTVGRAVDFTRNGAGSRLVAAGVFVLAALWLFSFIRKAIA